VSAHPLSLSCVLPPLTAAENRSASVALVYERDGKQITFKRSITPAGVGEYRIDGRTIKAEAYFARLKALGVHTKAHLGFLVFQGYVSELAAKSPMELTTLFEQISGAEELKEEYERLEREKKRAEEDQIYSYQKKKGLTQERTNMRKQKEEAEAYTELLEQRKDLRQRLYLMRLFGVEK
jgi:structural maintenance of chromosome 1